jgi:tetratricopeptide (TPR) repeat protein
MTLITRIANAVISYAAYLGKTLWPINLAAFYPYENPLPLWKIILSGFMISVITAAVLSSIRKAPFLFAGWFIYLGTLVPVIGLVQVGPQAMADRYTYLPSVGIAFMLAGGIQYLVESKNIGKKVLISSGTAMIIFLSLLTWRQCGYWKNSIELWNHALSVTGNNALAHFNRGNAYSDLAQNDLAIADYNEAIRLNPHYVYFYYNRGNAYIRISRYESAIADFNEAIRLKPDYADAYNDRGGAYSELGLYQQALEDLNKAITIKPDYARSFYNRGVAYTKMGQYQPAFSDYNEAIRLNPDHPSAYINIGIIYFNLENVKAGCYYAQKACSRGDCQLLDTVKGGGYCR